MNLRRNDPCFCGSGRRYKKCHGSLDYARSIDTVLRRHEANEFVRRQQQGEGKPILSFDFAGHKVVAVRNKIIYSKEWKTFPDFLFEYLIMTIDRDWVLSERAKSVNERHVLINWFEAIQEQRKGGTKTADGLVQTPFNGVSACVLGLAYGLYLLEHNAELQLRLVKRIKNVDAFQGAYYEVMIASVLLRSGFVLALEDENDRATRHCEFSAVRKNNGKRYWIECKARSVAGVLGKTELNGCNANEQATSKLIKHLTNALSKPADSDKLIFIDLNAPVSEGTSPQDIATLSEQIARMIGNHCIKIKPNDEAYVFVTNMPFHRYLSEPPKIMVTPFGINKPDFNVPGTYTLRETYRREKAHADAFDIAKSFLTYNNVPTTFDGSLISEREGSNRLIIGETYDFGDAVPCRIATVASACVSEIEKVAIVSVIGSDGRSYMLKNPMSADEIKDYVAHADAYFGEVRQVTHNKITSPYDMFKWLLDCYKDASREKLLEWLPDNIVGVGNTCDLDADELREIFCELTAIQIDNKGRSSNE